MSLLQVFAILRARLLTVLMTLVITIGATIAVSLMLPKQYTATTYVVIDFKSGDQVTGVPLPLQLTPGYMTTQTDIIESHRVALHVVEDLKLADNPAVRAQWIDDTDGRGSLKDWLADLLLRKLDVVPNKDSTVVGLQYINPNPDFAATMANAFAKAYIATNLEMRISPAQVTAEWFGDQLKTLRDNLGQAQNKLTTYQRAKGIISVDERLDVENARLNELSSQSVLLQAQTTDSEKRQRQAAEFLAQGSLDTLPEVLSNPFIQNLKSDILKSEANMKQLSSQVGINHPLYRRAQEELDSLKAKLTDEVKKIAVGLANSHRINQQREAQNSANLAAQKARVLSLKQVRDELGVFTRDVDSAQRAYDAAAQRLTQSSLESQANQTNITILSPALAPLTPSSPKIVLNVALSVVLGAMLGVGFALLRELTDQRIRRNEDLVDVCGVSVLAVVPTAKPGSRRFGWLRLRSPTRLAGAVR